MPDSPADPGSLDPLILYAMIDALPVGAVLLDAEGRVQVWNGWMVATSGIAPASATGRTLPELFGDQCNRRVLAAVDEALQYGRARVLSYAVHRHLLPLFNPDELSQSRRPLAQNVSILALRGADGRRQCLLQVQDVTAAAMREQRLNEELRINRRKSHLDSLTGLLNRRSMEIWLHGEWQRASRTRCPLSLLMVDVDYFKEYNDTLGHVAGDRCLRRLAECFMQRIVRPGDGVFRYGGEEFAILLTTTDRRGAEVVGSALIEAVRRLGIPHPGSPALVTVSIGGYALVPDASGSIETLLELADVALYQAKAGGRDRLVLHESSEVTDTDPALAGRQSRISDRSLIVA